MPLFISSRVEIPDAEIEINPIRSAGPGGQNVNKLATAVHLRFDIRASSLPDFHKERLLAWSDSRITRDGVVVIKAIEYRTQEKNREAALSRLRELVLQATRVQKPRKATKPTRASQRKRVDEKTHRGRIKALRSSHND